MRALIGAAVLAASLGAWAQEPLPVEPAPQQKENPVVMTVNGEPVYAATVSVALRNIAMRAARQGQQLEENQLFEAAAARVVDMKLLAQEARRREIVPGEDEVDGILAQVETRVGGPEQMAAYLQQTGMTRDGFRKEMAESAAIQTLIDEKIKPGITVSDEDVKAFYEANPAAFAQPDQVHARHILRTVDQGADDATRAAARAAAEKARERALAGEDFAALAEELSQGPSASRGGDLGFFSAGQMVPPFSEAAFGLEPGQISDVVETQFGYHVIKVEEKRAASTKTLAEVSDELRDRLIEQKLSATVEGLLKDLRESAVIEAVEPPPGAIQPEDAPQPAEAGDAD